MLPFRLPCWLRPRAASFFALAVLALAFVPEAVYAQSGEPTGGGGGGGGGAPLQTLSIYGTDAPSGTIDPNTDCSRDNQATWLPAYALDRNHPWGNMAGTTRWISRVVDGQSAAGISQFNPENLDFRIRFYAPADLTNPSMTFVINPDNFADIYLNGTKLNATPIEGPTNASFTVNAGIQPGLNTIIVRLIDWGGWLGINYKIDLSGNGSTPFQRLVAPPVVSSVTSTLPNGAYKAGTVIPIQVNFNRAVTVTGLPVLFLETGSLDRQAIYQSGSGTSTLNLTYTVQPGDASFDLDYLGAGALAGSIKAAASDLQTATLTLPAPGTANSLGANKALVIDTVAPVLTVPANITVAAPSASGVAVGFSASATDNVALASLAYSKNPGTVFPLGATVVTVTATDTAGNVATKTFTVTVRFITLTEDKTTVTVAEGSTATNAGTFSEGSGAAVTLTASKGTLTQTGAGQWTFQQVLTPGGNPIELVLDTQENLYVVSQTEVVKYDPTGALLTRWAVAGTPTGIAIDTAHSWLYVALRDGNAVKKFTLDGTLLLTITNGFSAPHCVATDASGTVYVTDAGNARVQVFDSNGTFLRQWGSSGNGNGQFSFPQGIRITPGGTVYVADRNNNRIQYFNTSGAYLGQWGSGGTGNGQFNSPAGVGIDPSGNVYVGDINNNRVQKFSATGSYLDQVGPGTGGGTLSMPHGTAFPPAGRSVYIASWNNGSVVKYLTPGAWSWTYAAPIGSVGSSTVTVTANDGLGTATQNFTLVVTDGIAPRVASIVRQSPTISPTNADTLTFRVSFNEAVTGVDASDFVVGGTTATASVATVSSLVYDVTLSGGNLAALNGTATLSLSAGQNIKDTAGNALVNTTPTGTNVNTYVLLNNLAPTDLALSVATINQSAATAGATIGTLTTVDPDAGDTAAYALVTGTGSTDNGSFSVIGSTLKISGTVLAAGNYSVRVSTTDSGGLSFAKALTITVVDDVAPDTTIAARPASVTNSTSATFSFTSTEAGTFEAKLDGAALTAATTPLTLNALGDGSHTFQVRAKDAAGNFDATPASYTWLVDATGPVITVPTSPIVAEATGPDGAAVSFSATATDARDGAVLATPSAASGSTFHLGDTLVTVTASDSAGNTSTKSFTITVRDTTAPAISVSLPATPVLDEKFNGYTGGNPNGPQYLSGLNVQYGGNVPAWTKSGFVNAVHAVNLSGAGNWAVMFYAPDVLTLTNGVAANAAGATYSVSFLAGPAVYQDPGQATGADDGLVIEILRADGSILKSFSHKPGAYAGVSSLAPASYAYTGDGTGNVTVRIHTIDANSGRFGGVIDNLVIAASTAAGTVADLTFEATSPAGAVANYDAVAYDLVSGIVPVASSAPSGGTFVIGTTPVTLTAVDAAGNPATASFNVIVRDTIKPTLVVPASLTVAATSAAGATVDFTATTADTASTPSVTYSQNPGTVFPLGLTTVNVVATDGSGNTQTGSFTVTVNPTVASIAFTTPAYIYDGTAKVATVTTTPAGLPVTLVYDGASDSAPVNAGPHAVTASVNLPWISGSTTGSFSITPASLNVAAATITKVYGSADPSLAFTITDGALVQGDAFTGGLARMAGENVGSYAIAQGTLSAGSNYTLGFTGATLAITPKPASVAAAAATKVYGAVDPVLTGTLAGFLPADNVVAIYGRTAGENVAGGPYAISAGFVANPALTNYAITATTAAFSITPAPLAVVANAQSKVYGAADPALTFAATGLQFTDTAASVFSGALSRVAGETVLGSPYAIQRGTLLANSNYTLGYTGANLAITPATATIAVNGFTGVYDGQPHGATGTATGVSSANLASMLNLGASFTNVPGGTATWTFHDAAGNYSDATGSVAVTLTKADATIAVTPYTVIYDGNAHTATGTAKGALGETLAGLSLAATTHTAAGTFTDTWTFTDATGNYAAATGTATDNIGKAAATIAVAPYGVVYDTQPHTATGTAKGVKGETLAGLSLTATTHTNAGSYTDTWTFTDVTGNYVNASGSIIDAITKAPAPIVLAPLAQMYDGTPRTVLATTAPAGLTVTITYNGGTTAPSLPGSYTVVATIVDANYMGTQSATLTVGVTAIVRRGLTINGDIDGSVQVLTAENNTFNGNAGITGDLLVPGKPTVQLNGHPTFAGTQDGTGAATPTNYTVTLNGNALLRYLIRRTDPIAMPVVAAPAQPTGTRGVNLNKSTDPIGAWATLKELTLNGNMGHIAVPAGVYGSFTANGGSGFTLGVAGATTPSVYQFQSLTLNGNAVLNIVGPVIVVLKNDLNLNGIAGSSAHPEWLDLRISNGSLTLNGNVTLNGYVTAPSGTVTINGNSTLTGGLAADKLVVNGNGALIETGH